jgi:hypothetical protein
MKEPPGIHSLGPLRESEAGKQKGLLSLYSGGLFAVSVNEFFEAANRSARFPLQPFAYLWLEDFSQTATTVLLMHGNKSIGGHQNLCVRRSLDHREEPVQQMPCLAASGDAAQKRIKRAEPPPDPSPQHSPADSERR